MMEKPQRLPDWQPRLQAYLGAVAAEDFRPGRFDCALFVAGAVEAMTGADLAAAWRGYDSLAGGLRQLKAAGYADHVALVAAHFDEVLVEGQPAPAFAQPGDIAVVPSRDAWPALGIVQGAQVYALIEGGLALVSRLAMVRGFAV